MFSVLPVINAFSRLSLRSLSNINSRNISMYTHPLHFQVTNILLGMPIKKKRKMDPAITRARDDRRKRKLEKQIRRLEKNAKQMKPIIEVEAMADLIEQKEERFRDSISVSPQEIERRSSLEKEWSKYKNDQWFRDTHTIESIMVSQERALTELKAVSKYLYEKAIELDESLLPYSASGPVNTPPIQNYESPDGAYTDITIKYEGEA